MSKTKAPYLVLIAEDSPTQAEQLRSLLEQRGFEVMAAANGRAALALLAQRQPALVITDVMMPELDGYGLCHAIKSDRALQHIPVMLVTTLSDPNDVIRGLECGADNFVRKPYDERYLLARVDHLLMNRELRRSQHMQFTLELRLAGKRHKITAERQQILDLLISTFEQAVAVNAELAVRERELAHSNQMLHAVHRIAEGLNGVVTARDVAEITLERALELPGVQAGWIVLRDEAEEFQLAAARGLPPALQHPAAFEGQCTCRRMLVRGELDGAANIIECERLAGANADTRGLRCHASVPLWLGEDRLLGLMNLAGPGDGLFDEGELKTLYGIGNQVAIALERARLAERVAARTEELVAVNRSLVHAKAAAEDASHAKSAFLATMSHEIRTPMNGVIGMVDVLAQSTLNEHQTDLVRTIRDSANALLGIIDDILDFSKIEAGRLDLEQEPVSLLDLVESMCVSLLPVAVRRGVTLRLFVAPELPERVLSDGMRLRQVFYNLVGNAIKFSSGIAQRHGRVDVRVEVAAAQPLQVAIRVIDNGIGMSEQTVAALYRPFTQAEISTTRRFGGTGLGLTICKRLVDLLNGTIAAQSMIDQGSTFTVTLPLAVPPPVRRRYEPDLRGLDCIVLHSPDLDAADLRAYLEYGGAHVQFAADAAEAGRLARSLAAPVVVVQSPVPGARRVAPPPSLATLPMLRHVMLTHDRRRRARLESSGVVSIERDAMRRNALLRAVAVAAGRVPEAEFLVPGAAQTASGLQAPTIAEARAQGRLILVAEDDEINQKVILQQLALLGYAAEIAATGTEALRMWRDGSYALLLTDLHMPEMDGYTLVESIRRDEVGGTRMPIVALSANAMRNEDRRVSDAGMDSRLTKPVRLPILRATLEKFLPPRSDAASVAAAPTGSAPAQALRALDTGVLKELVGDDAAVVHEFLADYRAALPRLVEELRTAIATDDSARAAAVAHKLKSSSRAVGALAVGDLCAEIENLGKRADMHGLQHTADALDAMLDRVLSEIARELGA